MKLYIPELKKGEGEFFSYDGTIELNCIKLDYLKEQPVQLHVNLKATYVQNRVLLKGTWHAEIDTECHRCLTSFALQFDEMLYEELPHLTKGIASERESKEGIELRDGESFAFKGDTLDLTDLFEQLFLMSQPLKMICQEDCRGLCSTCGANKNLDMCSCEKQIDPRWVILDKLKKHS